MAPSLPSFDALEALKPELYKLQTKWPEHLLFIDAETSSPMSIEVNDPFARVHDILTRLAGKGRVLDVRMLALVSVGHDLSTSGKWWSMNQLLALCDKAVGNESVLSVLRRVAARLEREIKEISAAISGLEDETAEGIQMMLDNVDFYQRAETKHSTSTLIERMEHTQQHREELEKEPIDVLWTDLLRLIVEHEEDMLKEDGIVERIAFRHELWVKLLSRLDKMGCKIGARQALITEYFAEEGDESDDESHDESDDENETDNEE